jgi:peptidyl-prolyl cis-trans isomerase SurA
VEIKEILPDGDQDLDEIKGQAISDYQTKLENDWVAELRAKYQVDIHETQVDAVYEQYNN